MLGEIIIWNLISAAAKSHNKKVQEEFRKQFTRSNFETTLRTKEIQTKPFSQYLEEAMNKIK